jgi:hypothetical protein
MKKNTFIEGFIWGSIPAVLAFILTQYTQTVQWIGGKPLSWYVLAGLANILMLRYAAKHHLDLRLRGLIFVTFAAMLALLLTKQIVLF